jgi:hypothetical protein
MAQAVECLFSRHNALISILSTTKKYKNNLKIAESKLAFSPT